MIFVGPCGGGRGGARRLGQMGLHAQVDIPDELVYMFLSEMQNLQPTDWGRDLALDMLLRVEHVAQWYLQELSSEFVFVVCTGFAIRPGFRDVARFATYAEISGELEPCDLFDISPCVPKCVCGSDARVSLGHRVARGSTQAFDE